RVVRAAQGAVLIGQPPEVLKGIWLHQIKSCETLVLCDTVERDGSLLNNLESPLHYFLFMGKGLREGKRLNLVGEPDAISRALRLLRLTLLGPTGPELEAWGTPEDQRREWLAAARHLALKHPDGSIRTVDSFFNILPFVDGAA